VKNRNNPFFREPASELRYQGKVITFKRPLLVGIVNVTPDSFSGDGLPNSKHAIEKAFQMIEDGADWIDIGGESTGPESKAISVDEELNRVLPVIEKIRKETDIWSSIDTWRASVARRALEAGVNTVNDVTALMGDPNMVRLLAGTQAPIIIMYSKDPDPRTTTKPLEYENVIKTINNFFRQRLEWMVEHGIRLENVVLDPGMGFFISGVARYSFEIINRMRELMGLGFPIMFGPSRKSFLAGVSQGKILAVHERELPSMVAAAIGIWEGATLVRLHDVKKGRLTLDTLWAIRSVAKKR